MDVFSQKKKKKKRVEIQEETSDQEIESNETVRDEVYQQVFIFII